MRIILLIFAISCFLKPSPGFTGKGGCVWVKLKGKVYTHGELKGEQAWRCICDPILDPAVVISDDQCKPKNVIGDRCDGFVAKMKARYEEYSLNDFDDRIKFRKAKLKLHPDFLKYMKRSLRAIEKGCKMAPSTKKKAIKGTAAQCKKVESINNFISIFGASQPEEVIKKIAEYRVGGDPLANIKKGGNKSYELYKESEEKTIKKLKKTKDSVLKFLHLD